MPEIIGFNESTFNPEAYRRVVCDNHGSELTTQGILEGLALVAADMAENPKENWLAAMKETPYYISPK